MAGRTDDTGERGSATVWTVALAGLLAALGAVVVLVGSAVVARHRAGAAADLAALAAAGSAVQGDPGACSVAEQVAAANGATVDSCSVSAAAVVELRVHVPVRLGPLGVAAARGRARAGPAPPDTGPTPPPAEAGSEHEVVGVLGRPVLRSRRRVATRPAGVGSRSGRITGTVIGRTGRRITGGVSGWGIDPVRGS